MPLLDPQMSAMIGALQSLDDAIAYRLGRLTRPCPGCGPAARCAEHRHDEELLASYQDRYAAAFRDALASLPPGDVALVMQPGGAAPCTAAVLSVAVLARLRALAADGPAVVELDGRTVLIEQDGPVIIEHPLTSSPGGQAAP
jgi:hypothetical protein